MIIAKQKEKAEILDLVAPYDKILIVGCGTCMAACSAGGQAEVAKLADDLLSERAGLVLEKAMLPKQCSEKITERLEEKAQNFEAILSMACGNGVQVMAKHFPDKRILPALDTLFIGSEREPGVWMEMCRACGSCILGRTAGVCPMTRCAKGLLNGPCGGSQAGMCEVSKQTPCAWQEIYNGLKRLGLLNSLKTGVQIRTRHIRPGKLIREDLQAKEG